jgi:hypothetical protein
MQWSRKLLWRNLKPIGSLFFEFVSDQWREERIKTCVADLL